MVAAPPASQRVVMIGWNESAGAVMDNLDRSLGKGSQVVVYAPTPADERRDFLEAAQKRRKHTYANITVEHQEGFLGARFKLESLSLRQAARILILAHISGSAESTDNQTIAVILQVRDIIAGQPDSPRSSPSNSPVIVPQMLGKVNEEAVREFGMDDVINSTELRASILATISENPAMSAVLAEFLSETGVGFHIRELSEYTERDLDGLFDVANGVTFDQVSVAAALAGEVAVGWTKEGDPRGWEMNPKDRSRKRKLCAPESRIVALRRKTE